MTTASVTPATVQQIVPLLRVADPQRSADFYRCLGFSADLAPEHEHTGWLALSSGDARLLLAAADPDSGGGHGRQGLLLHVGDLLAARDALTVSGFRVDNLVVNAQSPHGELTAYDPDGHLLVIRPRERGAGTRA